MRKISHNVDNQLIHISEMLMINGTLLSHPGLIYGKTGIVIFFFHYAQNTGNSIYKDYVFYLMIFFVDKRCDYMQ